jgi:hypothetical protein
MSRAHRVEATRFASAPTNNAPFSIGCFLHGILLRQIVSGKTVNPNRDFRNLGLAAGRAVEPAVRDPTKQFYNRMFFYDLVVLVERALHRDAT